MSNVQQHVNSKKHQANKKEKEAESKEMQKLTTFFQVKKDKNAIAPAQPKVL